MKNLLEKFHALSDLKRVSYTVLPLLLALIWLVPWALERNYRIMRYFGERIERIPGPTKTTNE